MNKSIKAIFSESNIVNADTAWQYDYGLSLQLHGLSLPAAVEIHFSLQPTGGESVPRVGMTKDGVTTVSIPDSMLSNENADADYKIFAWVYLADETSGRTECKITIPVRSRPEPEAFETPEESALFREAIEAVNNSAASARTAEQTAKSWAVGRTGTRKGEDTDNSKYYAEKARDAVREIPGEVEKGKRDVDNYVCEKKAELKGETGNVYFAAFTVKSGRLKMYSDPNVDKVRFTRKGSRLGYRLQLK